MHEMESHFDVITRARKILELPEAATRNQIRENYHALLKKWHPDKNSATPDMAEKKSREIIHAYHTLLDYCDHYQYSFTRKEVDKYISDRERWFRQFGSDPIWA
jgi:DnaJ-class molecular chaperone